MNNRPDTADASANEFEPLRALGVLPPDPELAMYTEAKSPAAGLLAVWKQWLRTAPPKRRSRAARIYSGLAAAIANGAELTFSLHNRDQQLCEKWLGLRAFWWPGGCVDSTCVGIISSRLRREASSKSAVLQALNLSMSAIDPTSERVVASTGTSLSEYIRHCAKTLNQPMLGVSAPEDKANSKPWIERLIQPPEAYPDSELIVSPLIDTRSESDLFSNLPLRDRILALLSDRVFILTIRRNGNWWKLLQAGSHDNLWRIGTVRAISGRGLCTDDAVAELQNLGAVRWHLSTTANSADRHSSQAHSPVDTERTQSKPESFPHNDTAAEADLINELTNPDTSTEWLIHWTRTPQAERAGESRDDYLNNILQNEESCPRTAFGTLEHIVKERVIRATAGNTRTTVDTVCLSATPLAKLISQRIFRQHRGRWDFEHYGIGIRRNVIHSMGGRPVIYGDESIWESLPRGERSWFQLKQSRLSAETIDWTVENEWRLTIDVPLGKLPVTDVFAYCATEQEATKLRTICNWRVISVEQLANSPSSTVKTDER